MYIYRVSCDAHADILLVFFKLDDLGDRQKAHLIKLIKSFVSGRCHPAVPLFINVCTNKSLANSPICD